MKNTLILVITAFLIFSCSDDEYEAYPSPGRQIKSFTLESGQYGNSAIRSRENDYTVVVNVSPNTDLTSIVPIIGVSERATINPPSAEPIDISQNREVIYTVTAPSGQQREWRVIFNVIDNSIGDYGVYEITSKSRNMALNVEGEITQNDKYWDNARVGLRRDQELQKWQKWHIIYNSSEGGIKFYKIRNLFSGKFLSVSEENINQEGGQLIQLGYEPDAEDIDHKLWSLSEDNSNSGYIITNKASRMVLTAASDESTQVNQNTKADSEAQVWTLNSLEEDSYRDDKVVNFFERNRNYMGSVAFDQGNSIPLSWGPNAGKILWVTEDAWDGTSLNDNDKFNCSDVFRYNNSILIQPSKDDWDPENTVNLTNPDNPGKPRQIAPNQPGTGRTWPGAGVEIGNKVYTFTAEGNGLENVENVLYALTQNEGTEWQVERINPEGALGDSGMVKGNDGYIYAYTTKSAYGYNSSLYVARFPENDPLTWTFWDGSEWGSVPPELNSPGVIAHTLGSTGIAKLNGKYLMMTMDNGYFCNDDRGSVYIATSDSPTGPFTEKKKVYQITEYLHGQYARYYTPVVHPFFDNGHQELLITYCLNFGACEQESCDADGFLDPYYYRLKAIRVPYAMIGL